jgi:hypothetical protein
MFEFTETLTPQLCQASPDKTFVFGDNMIFKGKAGQAVIRDEPNAFGVPTKRLPSMSADAFFSDREDEYSIVREKLIQLWTLSSKGKTIVLPINKIGSGLANIKERSPQIAKMIDKFYSAATQPKTLSEVVKTINSTNIATLLQSI